METSQGQVVDGNPGQRFPHMRTFQGRTVPSLWASSATLIFNTTSIGSRSIRFDVADNRWTATSSQDQNMRILDPFTAEWRCTFHGHSEYVRTVDFSLTGKYLASGAEDGLVRLWRYM